ncbi:MAG: hypothetical protein QOJ07_1912 [Thermoleophilaceae bacterium]|nr:hypothetical protein [Thermoleophilaceae bacterium]
MSDEQARVLIIGAGPAGLTAAASLRRVGIRSEIFERAGALGEIGAGIGLQTNALRALLRIGVGGYMIDHGNPVESQEIYSNRGRLLARLPQGEVAREKGIPGVSIERTELQKGLLREVDARTIHLGAECVSIEEDDAGVTAHFADGRRARGALVVGADGLRSVVRAFMHGLTDPHYSGFTSWRGIATVDPSLVPTSVISVYIGPGRIYWSASVVAPEGSHDAPQGQRAEVLRHFARYPAPAQALIEGTPEGELTRTDIHDRDPVTPWSKGRMVLIGDAAHPTTPFMGQGAGIAIEDGIVLARELSLSRALDDRSAMALALRSYEGHRAERANAIVLESRRRGQTYSWKNPVKCALRNTGMSMVPARKWRQVVADSIAYDI